MPRKQLPHGNWLTMVNLPEDVDEADIVAFFHKRTGIELPFENIQINDPLNETRNPTVSAPTASALISLDQQLVLKLVDWAFHLDNIGGRPVRWLSQRRTAFNRDSR